MWLAEKVIVITGAAKGIGAGIARACASEGAQVVLNFRTSEEEARALAEEITASSGRRPTLAPFDVSQPDAVTMGCEEFWPSIRGSTAG